MTDIHLFKNIYIYLEITVNSDPNRTPIARLGRPWRCHGRSHSQPGCGHIAAGLFKTQRSGMFPRWGWVKTLVPSVNPKIAGIYGCE